jgi:CrcB protein
MTKPFVLVFLGGGLGSALRLLAYRAARLWLPPDLPWGTFAVNVAGSLAAGLIAGLLAGRGDVGENSASLFLLTGLLGGFTTFSAFSLDAVLLWQRGDAVAASAYAAGTVLLALAAAVGGFALARAML